MRLETAVGEEGEGGRIGRPLHGVLDLGPEPEDGPAWIDVMARLSSPVGMRVWYASSATSHRRQDAVDAEAGAGR